MDASVQLFLLPFDYDNRTGQSPAYGNILSISFRRYIRIPETTYKSGESTRISTANNP